MAYKVIQWATGAVGSLTLREIVRNHDLELGGVLVYSPDKDGRDAGELVSIDPTGVTATCEQGRDPGARRRLSHSDTPGRVDTGTR
jgi:hypothetical protein